MYAHLYGVDFLFTLVSVCIDPISGDRSECVCVAMCVLSLGLTRKKNTKKTSR